MNTIRGALLAAGTMLALAAALVFAVRLELITSDTQLRAMGVVIGLFLVAASNAVPKQLKPLSSERCEPARAQSLRRFMGWTMTLAGVGHIAVWLALPIGMANIAAMSIVAAALLLVTARVVASRRTSSRAT